jgi:membrane protease YdiL (CAAX protease family)
MDLLTTTAILRAALLWVIWTMFCGAIASWVWALHRLLRGQPLLPETPLVERRKPPWGLGTVLLLIVAWYLVTQHGLELYAQAARRGRPSPRAAAHIPADNKGPEEPRAAAGRPEAESLPFGLSMIELMFVQAAINEVLIVVLPSIAWLTSGARLRDLGLSLRGWKRQVATGAVVVLILMPIVYGVQMACVKYLDVSGPERRRHPVERMIRDDFSPGVAYLAFLTAVILAPVFEELFFRGFFQSWLVKAFDRLARESRAARSRRHAPAKTGPHGQMDSGTGRDLIDIDPVRSSIDGVTGEPENEPLSATKAESGPDPERDSLGEAIGPEVGRKPSAPDQPLPHHSQSRRWTVAAIALTSLFFAALHFQQWPAPIPLFVLSLGLGLVYERTGSLLAPICMHAIFNGFSTLTLIAMALEPQKDQPPPRPVLERAVAVEEGRRNIPDVGPGPRRAEARIHDGIF